MKNSIFASAAPEPNVIGAQEKILNPRVFEACLGGGRPARAICFRASYLHPTLGTYGSHCGVTFSRPALSCQAAASSHVLRVLIGRIVLPRSLGTHLGSAQVPPGQLPASVVDKFAVAE